MPGEHAVLSPSASERWISCPASVRMAEKVPEAPDSPYAAEGTAAHALGELRLRWYLHRINDRQYVDELTQWMIDNAQYDYDEMVQHIGAYVALVDERRKTHPNTAVLVEQNVQTGIPQCSGTADVILVSPTHVEIIDLKYGAGVAVHAEGNSQLRLYAVGALEEYGDVLGTPTDVYMTVFQPRIGDGHADTAHMTADDLRAWRDSLRPMAQVALGDDAPFGPSDEACRWCPASGRCAAQLEWVTQRDFGDDPDVLSPEELAEALAQVPAIQQWLNALEVVALRTVYSEGKSIPGFKVVMSGGQRYVSDPGGLRDELTALKYDEADFITEKVVGIGELEKLVGRKNFDSVLGAFIGKTTGKPSLVPETDKRASINPNDQAVKEFSE